MPPVQSLKNQYRGINAHLHSFWQAEGGWHNFHNRHIGDLAGMLRLQLLPMGYTAEMEAALQIRRLGDTPQSPRSDILISDRLARHSPFSGTQPAADLTVLELVEADEDVEKPYRAIAIYERNRENGEPVAWIELLSPSNKGSGQDALTYRAKRRVLLEQGLVFVEIDYLHETPHTFTPRAGSHPYHITVLDPRPDMQHGPAHPTGFYVDDPIPQVTIPLNAGDQLPVDFGAAYRKTFEEMGYGLELVDYTQLPLNFDRYAESDRARIVARMLAVLKAARDGLDLDAHAPLPVESVPLEDGLRALSAL